VVRLVLRVMGRTVLRSSIGPMPGAFIWLLPIKAQKITTLAQIGTGKLTNLLRGFM